MGYSKKIAKQMREAGRLDLDDVAKMLKMKKRFVIGLLESGEIKFQKVNGEYVVYDTDVLDYMRDDLVKDAGKVLLDALCEAFNIRD